MSFDIRAITPGELAEFRRMLRRAFGADEDPDERADERFTAVVDLERTYAAFDGDTLVATAAAFDLELAVPGGALPCAGLTQVSVSPAVRRRGLLRALMAAHLRDVDRRGEALSGLWASEAGIYPRFGYGVAAERESLSAAAPRLQLDPELAADRVELVDDSRAAGELPDLFDRLRAHRPGTFARTPAWWEHRVFLDPAERREGASKRRYAVARRDGTATGYLIYRQRARWDEGLAAGDVSVAELLAADPRAEASLWRFAAGIDLFPNLSWWNAPTDLALPWLVTDRRQIKRRRVDSLWLRLCNIPRALAARAYGADGQLTLHVTDPVSPEPATADTTTFTLRVDDGHATCERSSARPDLHLSLDTLATIYLGGFLPSTLARAGRITGDPAAITTADRLFLWPTAPWCQEIF